MAQDSGTNKLFYGDNLQVLRERIADESVDLIYLDPPFNSKRDYNLQLKTQMRDGRQEPIHARSFHIQKERHRLD